MIKIDISLALFVYLLITVILVIGAWLMAGVRARLKTYVSEERFIWHCSICDNTYIDSKNEEISQCPKCGSYVDKSERAMDGKRGGQKTIKNNKGRKEPL
ncbi:MAG TPA: hypothetical protein PKY78_05135 [Candidatus Omnitrophota bacterium]|nr:hypothetical protein [Candidatus Omnitrophota bacterium]